VGRVAGKQWSRAVECRGLLRKCVYDYGDVRLALVLDPQGFPWAAAPLGPRQRSCRPPGLGRSLRDLGLRPPKARSMAHNCWYDETPLTLNDA
jgi:hypothetical protein